MGKQRLERGSDLASVTQSVSGGSKAIATGRVGPTWHLCPPPLTLSRWASQWVGADSWISKSSGGQRTTLAMYSHLGIWRGWYGGAGSRVGALPAFHAATSPASSPGPTGACCSSWQPRPPTEHLAGLGWAWLGVGQSWVLKR